MRYIETITTNNDGSIVKKMSDLNDNIASEIWEAKKKGIDIQYNILQKCIMCDGFDIHWFCNKCEERYSIHHPAVSAKMDRYRLKLELDKEFSNV